MQTQGNITCRKKVGDDISQENVTLRGYLVAMFIEFLFIALAVLVYLYLTH